MAYSGQRRLVQTTAPTPIKKRRHQPEQPEGPPGYPEAPRHFAVTTLEHAKLRHLLDFGIGCAPRICRHRGLRRQCRSGFMHRSPSRNRCVLGQLLEHLTERHDAVGVALVGYGSTSASQRSLDRVCSAPAAASASPEWRTASHRQSGGTDRHPVRAALRPTLNLAPCLPPFITRVRSGSGPAWTGLQMHSG